MAKQAHADPLLVELTLLEPPPMRGHAELCDWLAKGDGGKILDVAACLEGCSRKDRGPLPFFELLSDLRDLLQAVAETARHDRPIEFRLCGGQDDRDRLASWLALATADHGNDLSSELPALGRILDRLAAQKAAAWA